MKTKVLLLLLIVFVVKANAQTTIFSKITSNGIAPIPAFTLGEPAWITTSNITLAKNFQFSPTIGFGLLDFKMWFIDSWLRYNMPMFDGKLIATAGFNYPGYVGEKKVINNIKEDHIVRCLNAQAKVQYVMNESNSLILDYWYILVPRTKGVQDYGHYLSLVYSLEKSIRGKLFFGSDINLFYLFYNSEDLAQGLASSLEFFAGHKKTGLFIGTQFFVPINLPSEFAWNVSVGIKKELF